MVKKIFPVEKTSGKTKEKRERILIGTPALDGRVDAWYCFALHEIGKQALKQNIDVEILMLSYESILPMARNKILTAAIEGGFDAMVFIDSDVYCPPEAFIKAVKTKKDVLAIPTVKKSDQESYDIYLDQVPAEKELLKALRVSTSCLKISKKALSALSDNSTQTVFRGDVLKNICQYDFVGEHFMGEDIYLCDKLTSLGFEIWVDPTYTCMHIGPKVYMGDFKALVNNVNQSQASG